MRALIAGQGGLPLKIAAALTDTPVVAALEQHPTDGLKPDIIFRLERLGTLLHDLQKRDVTEVCFAGSIDSLNLDSALIDTATKPLIPRILAALGKGDDGALRIIIEIFEENGLTVKGAHEYVPELLPAPGVLTKAAPDAQAEVDARRGEQIVVAMGAADVGQSCVVRNSQALAVEAKPGTDWMLTSLSKLDARGGILFKAPKPDQDRRADLPMIGSATVELASRVGLRGIVISAGGVMILDLEETLAAANSAGLFLWVRES